MADVSLDFSHRGRLAAGRTGHPAPARQDPLKTTIDVARWVGARAAAYTPEVLRFLAAPGLDAQQPHSISKALVAGVAPVVKSTLNGLAELNDAAVRAEARAGIHPPPGGMTGIGASPADARVSTLAPAFRKSAVANALNTMVAYKPAGIVERVARTGANVATPIAAAVANPLVGAAVFGGMGADRAATTARQKGKYGTAGADAAVVENGMVQGGLGLLNVKAVQAPLAAVVARLPAPARAYLVDSLAKMIQNPSLAARYARMAADLGVRAAEGAALSSAQRAGENQVVRANIDPNRPWSQDVAPSAGQGAAINTLGSLVLRGAARPPEAPSAADQSLDFSDRGLTEDQGAKAWVPFQDGQLRPISDIGRMVDDWVPGKIMPEVRFDAGEMTPGGLGKLQALGGQWTSAPSRVILPFQTFIHAMKQRDYIGPHLQTDLPRLLTDPDKVLPNPSPKDGQDPWTRPWFFGTLGPNRGAAVVEMHNTGDHLEIATIISPIKPNRMRKIEERAAALQGPGSPPGIPPSSRQGGEAQFSGGKLLTVSPDISMIGVSPPKIDSDDEY